MINDLCWYLGGFLTPCGLVLGALVGSGKLLPLLQLARALRVRTDPQPFWDCDPGIRYPLQSGPPIFPPDSDKIDLSKYTTDPTDEP